MCGIAGFSLSPNEPTLNSRRLAKVLLKGIEHRGRDATGAAWVLPNNGISLYKKDVTASQYVRSLSMWRRTPVAILHTRAATKGSPTENVNNHPVTAGPIIGVHNGVIWNDDALFAQMGIADRRTAKVDSQAIFAAIAWGSEPHLDGNPRLPGIEHPFQALEFVKGSAAVAWLDAMDGNRVLHLAKVADSPLHIRQTVHGSLLFASTGEALDAAAEELGLEFCYRDFLTGGDYLAVHRGMVVESATFNPHPDCAWGKKWYEYDEYEDYSKGKSFVGTRSGVVRELNAGTGEVRHAPVTQVPDGTVKNDLCSAYLDPTVTVDCDGFFYYDEYEPRLKAQEDYFRGLDRQVTVMDKLDLHADVRPGDWVETMAGGEYTVAQVYTLPQTFPEGDYILRAWLKNRHREGGWEIVLLARQYHEFFVLDAEMQKLMAEEGEDVMDQLYA